MKQVNIDKIHSVLKTEVKKFKTPVVDLIELQTHDPFKVLLSTILSARTQDRTTIKASKKLFARVKKIDDLNKLTEKEIQNLIYPVGFYKTKAKHLKKLPEILKEKFSNNIPDTVEELTQLPGVGRKTANLVVAIGFRKPAICVDTHVHRIMNRLGYVKTRNPFQTEMAIRKKLPKKYWITINSYLVAYGQNICTPISPKCSICTISKYCNRIEVSKTR